MIHFYLILNILDNDEEKYVTTILGIADFIRRRQIVELRGIRTSRMFFKTCRFSDILIIGVKFPQVIPSNNDFMT